MTNQSGCEPLNLENRSSVNSDNFDATDLRPSAKCNGSREHSRRSDTVENIFEVISDPCLRQL